jgi:alpha-ketoglutarate-dependent taurine dioxygenase
VVQSEHGSVLRYRAKTPNNKVILTKNKKITEKYLYQTVDEVLQECVILKHRWTVGDILFVNNAITLHDRLPYVGVRKMLRVRFDEENNSTVKY